MRYREFPSVVELVSYVFCFHGLMCGPFCFYKDYIAFIDGSNYSGNVAAVATGNGVSNCDGHTLSTRNHLSLHAGSNVSVPDGRSGNNSHGRPAAPPAPGVPYSSRLSHVRFIYSDTMVSLSIRCCCCRSAV